MEGLRNLIYEIGQLNDPQHEVSLRIFINTAADGSDAWKEKAVALGVIEQLLKLLHRHVPEVTRMLAMWALSNLAHENATVQLAICQAPNTVRLIVQHLREAENDDVVEKVLWLLINLARLPDNRALLGTSELISLLADLLDYDRSANNAMDEVSASALKWSPRIIVAVTRALTNLFYEESAQRLFCSLNNGRALGNVLQLLSCSDTELRQRMVNVLLMLSAFSDDIRRKLLARRCISKLMRLLRASHNMKARRTIIQVLCNLARDPLAQEDIVKQRAVINIMDMLVIANDRELQTEVVSFLLNASKNIEVRDEICRAGGIPIFLDLIESIPLNASHDTKDLNFLSEILIICNRLTLLEKHRRKLRSERSTHLFNLLSIGGYPEVSECADSIINNLEIPDKEEVGQEEAEELVMVIDTADEGDGEEMASSDKSPPFEKRQSVLFSLLQRSTFPLASQGSMKPRSESIFIYEAEATQREKLQRMYIKRRQIINEILQTERIYVGNMETAIKFYLEPLAQQSIAALAGVVSPDEIKSLLSSIKTIFKLHSEFLKDLESEVQSPNPVKLGKLFIELASWLKMYSGYITNYDTVTQVLLRLKNNPAWNTFEAENRTRPECKMLRLADFLIQPIQRVPRYELLLCDVIHSTPESSGDLEDLQHAKESIEKAAQFLNEAKRRAEAQRQMIDIVPLIRKYPDAHSLLHPNRELKRQGIILASGKHSDSSAYVYLFLFNDLLLVTRPKRVRRRYRWRFTFNLSSTRLEDVPDSLDLKNAFKLITVDEKKGKRKEMVFYSSLLEEKQIWTSLLRDCIGICRSRAQSDGTVRVEPIRSGSGTGSRKEYQTLMLSQDKRGLSASLTQLPHVPLSNNSPTSSPPPSPHGSGQSLSLSSPRSAAAPSSSLASTSSSPRLKFRTHQLEDRDESERGRSRSSTPEPDRGRSTDRERHRDRGRSRDRDRDKEKVSSSSSTSSSRIRARTNMDKRSKSPEPSVDRSLDKSRSRRRGVSERDLRSSLEKKDRDKEDVRKGRQTNGMENNSDDDVLRIKWRASSTPAPATFSTRSPVTPTRVVVPDGSPPSPSSSLIWNSLISPRRIPSVVVGTYRVRKSELSPRSANS